MLRRNTYNSELRNITSRNARTVCHSLPRTNPSKTPNVSNDLSDRYCITDDGYIFASKAERDNYLIRLRLFQEADDYYDKYTHEIVLSFDNEEYRNKQPSNEEALPLLKRAVVRVYEKLYGKHNVEGMRFDYYAVLERRDKIGNNTHAHWHVLLHFPAGRKRLNLTEDIVKASWMYRRRSIGSSWARDVGKEPMTNVRQYIHDYLTKDPNAYHYTGGR
jgi:hypothetical protein